MRISLLQSLSVDTSRMETTDPIWLIGSTFQPRRIPSFFRENHFPFFALISSTVLHFWARAEWQMSLHDQFGAIGNAKQDINHQFYRFYWETRRFRSCFSLQNLNGGCKHREGNTQQTGTPFHFAYSTMQCVRVCLCFCLWCDVFILSSGSERSRLAIIFIYGSNCKPAYSIYTGCPKIATLFRPQVI